MRSGLSLMGALMLAGCHTASPEAPSQWRSLFDGETLDGWMLVHGSKPFEVVDGAIVGTTELGIATRYLTTEERFGDFILEVDVDNSDGDNSGIQFRSVTDASFYAGLTGYQLEIDHSDREWTGGIYFEGVGEWRAAPIGNKVCRAAWRPTGWNTLRLETRGQQMRTFVNGTPCVELYDDWLSEGHIGLQVHSVGQSEDRAGKATRWRNIRIIENPRQAEYTAQARTATSASFLKVGLSPRERDKGWELLKTAAKPGMSYKPGQVMNPIDNTAAATELLSLEAGDIARIPLSASWYHVVADVRIEPGTSGELRYPVTARTADGNTVRCNASYRLYDDRSLSGLSADDAQLMGSLTGLIASQNLTFDGPKYIRFGDSWRRLEIVVDSAGAEHWLNSVKVVDYSGCENLPHKDSVSQNYLELHLEEGAATIRPIKYLRLGSHASNI